MQKVINLSNILYSLGLQKESEELTMLIKMSKINLGTKPESIQNSLRLAFTEKSAGSYHIANNLIPSKIANLPTALTSFAAGKGRGDAKFKTNGATRGLDKAIGGGEGRIAGSLHGLGFAHDVLISTKKFTEVYNTGLNRKVIKDDPEIIHIMKEFADSNNLTWGGSWSKGGKIPVFHNGRSIDVGIDEIHHFEVKEGEITSLLPEPIKMFMLEIGMSPADAISSEKRKVLYQEILKAIKGIPSDKTITPTKNVQPLDTEEGEEVAQQGQPRQKIYGPTLE